MRELPILFSTPMVQAIYENRKTMTRRTAGLEKINIIPENWVYMGIDEHNIIRFFNEKANLKTSVLPRYQVGDKLWVKETFIEFAEGKYEYKAQFTYPEYRKWKPSLFLPKAAARIWLEITGVRCERLLDITEADAFAEGIEWKIKYPEECPDTKYYKDYSVKKRERFAFGYGFGAVNSFLTLWDSINGFGSHKLSPWVFVYEFKRIEKQ